jgi:hypothetical protein
MYSRAGTACLGYSWGQGQQNKGLCHRDAPTVPAPPSASLPSSPSSLDLPLLHGPGFTIATRPVKGASERIWSDWIWSNSNEVVTPVGGVGASVGLRQRTPVQGMVSRTRWMEEGGGGAVRKFGSGEGAMEWRRCA